MRTAGKLKAHLLRHLHLFSGDSAFLKKSEKRVHSRSLCDSGSTLFFLCAAAGRPVFLYFLRATVPVLIREIIPYGSNVSTIELMTSSSAVASMMIESDFRSTMRAPKAFAS